MGAIHTRDGELRIRAELIEVATRRQSWSDRFDRSLDDSLVVESDITNRIIASLQLQLTGEESARLTRRRPVNAGAHAAFLEGRFWRNKETDVERAIAAFKRAIDLDPDSAAAYAGLAEMHMAATVWSITSPDDARAPFEAALQQAEELDPTDVATIVQRAAADMIFYLDWEATQRHLHRAFELDPDYAFAHHSYGHLLALLGRSREATEQFEALFRGMELPPPGPVDSR